MKILRPAGEKRAGFLGLGAERHDEVDSLARELIHALCPFIREVIADFLHDGDDLRIDWGYLYVAAPASTFDLRTEQSEVRIEERSPQEVTHMGGKRIVPKGVPVFNPAFDLTPVELVTGFITEKGLLTQDTLEAKLSEHES
jgi:hypothetical protein